eukprot:scaffold255243_cov48-Attheya_sp.AAC.3
MNRPTIPVPRRWAGLCIAAAQPARACPAPAKKKLIPSSSKIARLMLKDGYLLQRPVTITLP